jgi:hypothetical protein
LNDFCLLLRRQYDCIVIIAPPLLTCGGAELLRCADAVVLVLCCGETSIADAKSASGIARATGANIDGFVLAHPVQAKFATARSSECSPLLFPTQRRGPAATRHASFRLTRGRKLSLSLASNVLPQLRDSITIALDPVTSRHASWPRASSEFSAFYEESAAAMVVDVRSSRPRQEERLTA